MNELDRKIKDLKVICYGQPFAMALIDILEIILKDSIQNAEESTKMVKARLLLVRENLAMISKFWERVNNEKDEKIETLKELVIKQTKTAALLDPLRKADYWQRLNEAGFYDDNSDRIIKYVIEIYRLLEQQNTAD